jgi:hypothetical protein
MISTVWAWAMMKYTGMAAVIYRLPTAVIYY